MRYLSIPSPPFVELGEGESATESSPTYLVTLGLDPRVQPSVPIARSMDGRIKSDHDESLIATSSDRHPRPCAGGPWFRSLDAG